MIVPNLEARPNRAVIILDGALGETPDDSAFKQSLPNFQILSELGSISRLNPLTATGLTEATWLGIPDDLVKMNHGPLVIASLGVDPPNRSLQFAVTPCSLGENEVVQPLGFELSQQDFDEIWKAIKRLDTAFFTSVKGTGDSNGLVWEGKGDFVTTGYRQALGKPYSEVKPDGDSDALRQWIEDSVNVLNELELNHRRIDEGLAPVNLMWPWGEGRRASVPNLALRRGAPAKVFTDSLRLGGLSRLAGYRPAPGFGKGTSFQWTAFAQAVVKEKVAISFLEHPSNFRDRDQLEELHWWVHHFDRVTLPILLDSIARKELDLLIVLTGPGFGLSIKAPSPDGQGYEISEDLFDSKLPRQTTFETIDRFLTGLA